MCDFLTLRQINALYLLLNWRIKFFFHLMQKVQFTRSCDNGAIITQGNFAQSNSVVCPFSNATKFKGETSGLCCKSGRVQLLNLHDPPEPLNHLMLGDIPESRHFLENIRKYNSCFQITSFGVTKETQEPGYMPTFKIQGQVVYHTAGSLLPLPEDPRYLQIYFMGNDAEETNRDAALFLESDTILYILCKKCYISTTIM